MKRVALESALIASLPIFAAMLTGAAPAKRKPIPAAPQTAAAKEPPKEAQQPKKPVDDDPLSDDSITAPTTGQAAGPAAQKSGPSVLVLPFQPIYRSVAQNKIQLANDLLAKELNQKDTLVVIRGGVSKGDGVAAPKLDGAVKAAEAANKAEADHDVDKAIGLRKSVIAELEKNAAAVEPDDYVLAHHYLARSLMWAGQDKEAVEAMEGAARMRPAFGLEIGEFSRLYRKWFAKAAERAVGERPGDLMVKSALPGAHITLDGRSMDVAPVLLKKVVPGKHLIGARIEGVPPFAAVVDVKGGKANELVVTFANTMGGSSVGIVADAISENSMPKKAVESAAQAGKDAGAAFVVAGGLAKDDDRFHVHTFVVDVAKSQVKPLDVVDFDLDMLTAESDVLRVVQHISATVASFGSGENAVAMIEKRIRSQNTVNEVNAAPSLAADDGGKRDAAAQGKAKKRDVFKPLKGTKVQIKDEEEGD